MHLTRVIEIVAAIVVFASGSSTVTHSSIISISGTRQEGELSTTSGPCDPVPTLS